MKATKHTNQRRKQTCFLANLLVYQRGCDRSKAFKAAHALYRVVEQLAKGICEFTYMKEDGSLRHARGTLCEGVSAKFDAWKRRQAEKAEDKEADSKTKHPENVTYWDLDKEAFRTFKAENLVCTLNIKD